MNRKSERLWRGFAILAAFAYLIAIFAAWFSPTYQGKSWLEALAETFTKAYGAWGSVLGIAALVLCYLILVFALLGPRRSALSLEPLRTALALALVAVTVVEILRRLPGYSHPALIGRFAFRGFSYLGYGAWAALGSSLALLLAVAVLDAGDLGSLLDRLPAWARLDRLEMPDEVARKPTVSATERSRRRWTGVLAELVVVLRRYKQRR